MALLAAPDWNTPRGWVKLSEAAPHKVQKEAPPWQGGVSLSQWLWWDQYKPTPEELRKWIKAQTEPTPAVTTHRRKR